MYMRILHTCLLFGYLLFRLVPVKTAGDVAETDEPGPCGYEEDHPTEQKPKRATRPTPSVNENLEPAYHSLTLQPMHQST